MSEQAWRAVSRSSIEIELPQMLETSSEALLEQIGTFWLAAQVSEAKETFRVFAPPQQFELPRKFDQSGQTGRIVPRALGSWVLYDYLRPIICAAANRKIIDDTLKTANVAAVVDLVLPHIPAFLGQQSAVFPVPVLGLAVLILRIGLNEYCKSRGTEETPSSPSVAPKTTAAKRRRGKSKTPRWTS